MIRETLTVTNPKGIHARPSALVARAAQEFQSSIRFEFDGETADARDIMQVLSLGVDHGDVLTVIVDGADEAAALERLQEVFAMNFSEE